MRGNVKEASALVDSGMVISSEVGFHSIRTVINGQGPSILSPGTCSAPIFHVDTPCQRILLANQNAFSLCRFFSTSVARSFDCFALYCLQILPEKTVR